MASKPHLTTHNLASFQLAFKKRPNISPSGSPTVHQQGFNTMNPTTRNHVLVPKTQIVSPFQFARLEANQAKQWEIPTQFRMTQVDNLDRNSDANSPLGAGNQSATTTKAAPVVTVALATPAINVVSLAAAIPSPAPAAPRRQAPPSTTRSVRLSIEYVIWLSASLPATVKKSAGSIRGKAPPKWTRLCQSSPCPTGNLFRPTGTCQTQTHPAGGCFLSLPD
ncbi:hypothetical protein PCASD_15095 [Puccinia coronata f. sp. avenae]|uniref:Uncharacterized protein n=1 Tax=Puccinia coronata f. sp. avenae TaxID=200324 RepID=A0A2N5T688_9BASI|nr:hypothetical protein PCASD_15095 [Puccinia coronata f. sp. avenae]